MHFDNVLQVADKARQKQLGASAALLYDELSRKSWADQTALRLAEFSVERAAATLDQVIHALHCHLIVYKMHIDCYLPVRAQSVAPPTACVEYRVVPWRVRRVLLLLLGAQSAAVLFVRAQSVALS